MYSPGDLVFVRGTEITSKAVEDITHSPYSHVAGIIKQNELIEAQAFRKTGYLSISVYDGCSDVYTCPTATDAQRQQIVNFVVSKIGTHYDYALLGWELVHYTLHFNLPYHEGNCYDCSQLWLDGYRSAGIDLCPGLEYASPGDLAQSKLLQMIGPLK